LVGNDTIGVEVISVMRVLTVGLALVLAACSTDMPEISVGEVEFSGVAWSGEVSLYGTADGRAVLTWHEPVGEERFALRVAVRSGEGWSEPGTIVESDRFFVNWADFPSLVEFSNGDWIVHWLEKVPGGTYAYHVKLARSSDGGVTWGESFSPHRDDSPTEHGFVSMVSVPGGEVALVWLDGRQMQVEDPEGHGGLDRGDMSIRATTVGLDGTLGPDVLLDPRTCECCQTALVRTDRGLVAAYRDRSEVEVRNISVVRYEDGSWTEPSYVADDAWTYPGCPVNGPQLSASGETVAVAWFTAPEQQAKTYVAFSRDAGTTFGAPIQIDDGDPLGRVDIELLPDGSALVVWLERTGVAAEVRARLIRPDGSTGESRMIAESSESRASGFPRTTRLGDTVIVAWTLTGEDGGVRVASVSVTGDR
jgi:hypothetical protein